MTATPTPSAAPSQEDGQQPMLTIGDRSYPVRDLSEEAQKLVLAVRDCDEQIMQSKRRLNYLEIARRTLIQELTARLPDS